MIMGKEGGHVGQKEVTESNVFGSDVAGSWLPQKLNQCLSLSHNSQLNHLLFFFMNKTSSSQLTCIQHKGKHVSEHNIHSHYFFRYPTTIYFVRFLYIIIREIVKNKLIFARFAENKLNYYLFLILNLKNNFANCCKQ